VSYIVLWVLVACLCAVVVALARQIGTLHLRVRPRGGLEMDSEGPPLGEAPEPAAAAGLGGPSPDLGGPGEARVLLFASPGCILCEEVLPALPAVARAAGASALVVTELDREEAASAFGHRRTGAPVLSSPDAYRSWNVPGTPYVVVLDELGVVRAKGTPNNLEQLEGLVDSATRRAARAREVRAG
jgi:methylamine dehydrogenase accessory protein MauD